MVAHCIKQGLIISAGGESTAALDELGAYCGWPAVLQATPARLRSELSWGAPKVSLVWLDDRRELAASVGLLAWLRAYRPAVRRLAVAYRVAAVDLEPAIRSAGVHFFMAVDGHIRALAEGLRCEWLPRENRFPPRAISRPREPVVQAASSPWPYADRPPSLSSCHSRRRAMSRAVET